MIKWILAVIFIILAQNCAYAIENDAENLVTTPDASDKVLEDPIGVPRLPRYDEITADDQPDHHPDDPGRVKFEDDSIQTPTVFENEYNKGYANIDKKNAGVNQFDQNDRILTPDDHFEGEDDHNVDSDDLNSSYQEPDNFSSEENNDADDSEPENDTGQAEVNNNDENINEDYSEPENIQTDDQNTQNLDNIDMDQTDSEKETDLNNSPIANSNIAERINPEESEKQEIREPIKKQKRRPRGKPRFDALSKNTGQVTPNGYPGYSPYPNPAYPNPGDPNSGYTGYPYGYMPPSYPNYPSPYPASPYPSPGYPSYSPYPHGYPGSYPGYPSYQPYQVPPETRPQPNPIGYPAQNDQVTQADTKHPTREYPGAVPNPQGMPGRPDMYTGQDYGGYPPTGYQGYGGYGFAPDPNSQYGQYRPYPGYGYYRPPRRPKTITQRAISAVAEALTSIALFDDKQCVPRLLCEVASGSAASSPTLQKATTGLTPLLTVLQSYNGMSSSPLFIFGRAAVLGMTTKGNPTACKYAYSECPNDPEGLMNYLNNHNGGFFRFFGQPENPKQPQDLEQFYNHLSGQYDYGQQQVNQQPAQQQPVQQPYSYPYPYGMPYPYPPNYGPNYYPEQNSYRNSKDIDSEASLSNIEERIQNKPGIQVDDDKQEQGSKWAFPDEVGQKKPEDKPRRQRKQRTKKPRVPERPTRGGSTLKFPDDRGPAEDQPHNDGDREFNRPQQYIPYPNHFNFHPNYQTTQANLADYEFDHKHNFYVKRPKPNTNTANKDDGDTVYIVRGNGDPNHPEVVKLRPGQSP